MAEDMLRIEGLEVRYGDLVAVAGASLRAEKGRIVSLMGANGSGKSSLLDTAAGLMAPAAGKVFFKGEDITGLPAWQVVNRGLSLVPQGARCFARMSVEDNLIMGSYPAGARRGARERLERVYDLFPALREKRRAAAGTLSGGQRQMAAIGRALMSRPEMILFDEISLGLAPVVMRDLYAAIRRINREEGTTVLFVEQNTELALRESEACHVMLRGRVVISGPSRETDPGRVRAACLGFGGEEEEPCR